MAALLGKDAILAADDIQSEIVEVPEWGGSVIIRGLTGHQRDDWEASMVVRRGRRVDQDMTDFRARLVVRCAVDETGQMLFTDADTGALSGKSGAALDRLYTAAARLSGISERDVEDLTKDFGTEPAGGDSSST